MDRKDQKGELSDLFCDHRVNSVPFPRLRVIPISEVPADVYWFVQDQFVI